MNTIDPSPTLSRLSIVSIFASLLLLPLATALHAAPLASWTVVSGSIVDGDTDHPSFGAGSSAIKAEFDTPVSLAIGDTLTLSGQVTFVFSGNGADGGFRWGLFNSNASNNDNGWSGYITGNKYGSTGTVPFYEKDAGSGGWNSTSTEGYSQVPAGDITDGGGRSNYALSSGTYALTFSLERQSNGILVNWSLKKTEGNYSLVGSWLDTTPVVTSINRIVFQTTSGFGQTSATFSNLDLTKTSNVPEPGAVAFLTGVGALLVVGVLRVRSCANAHRKISY
ncbi:hypothetical protein OpiT1DRAFT_03720 [Opitutaceae bacterium TAV1]|nr:hypothetical protein OpiT1DRAFT_03720 [Opitutaceae bacterium TAV1]